MDTNTLKQIIVDQKQDYVPTHIVDRDSFCLADKLIGNKLVGIITGIRRCGKSVLLHTIRDKLPQNDYFINFEDDRLATFKVEDFQQLLLAFIELYGEQKVFYFDEIQNIPEWERFVRRLHNQGNKVFITGSNARLFSKELGTKLTGRYLAVEMFPCSFREFITFQDVTLNLDLARLRTVDIAKLRQLFSRYCLLGGLPEYYQIQQPEYLHTLYENILYKDIISRYRLTSERTIKALVYYLASNLAKETNFTALKNVLNIGSQSSVSDYCSYLEDSYLCFFINKFSRSLKKQYGYNKKVYFIDIALARSVGFRLSEDSGRLLENLVFLELKRSGKEIYFHQEKVECDFIIKMGSRITMALQVCVAFNSDKTRQRELAGLKEAMDCYQLSEGWVITEDLEETIKYHENGKVRLIKIRPIWKWLLQQT